MEWSHDDPGWASTMVHFGRGFLLWLAGLAAAIACLVLLSKWGERRAVARQEKIALATADCLALWKAVEQFHGRSNQWPDGSMYDGPYRSTKPFMDALIGAEAGFQPSVPAAHAKARGYFAQDGTLRDTWGTPFQIFYDVNSDGRLSIPANMRNHQFGRVLVVSAGPDRDFFTVADNAAVSTDPATETGATTMKYISPEEITTPPAQEFPPPVVEPEEPPVPEEPPPTEPVPEEAPAQPAQEPSPQPANPPAETAPEEPAPEVPAAEEAPPATE